MILITSPLLWAPTYKLIKYIMNNVKKYSFIYMCNSRCTYDTNRSGQQNNGNVLAQLNIDTCFSGLSLYIIPWENMLNNDWNASLLRL